jgi:hypothetical protein
MTDATPLSPDQLAWLRHAAALGHAEPQALLHLLGRVEALEAAAAGPQPDKLDRLAGLFRAEDEAEAALPEPLELSDEEAISLWGPTPERFEDCARRIHRAGWDAAMEAVQVQQQQAAAKDTPAPAPSARAALERAEYEAFFPTPVAPAMLVQQLAELIADFASVGQPGDSSTAAAIQAVRMVSDWAENRHGFHVPFDLRTEADRAAAGLEGRDG